MFLSKRGHVSNNSSSRSRKSPYLRYRGQISGAEEDATPDKNACWLLFTKLSHRAGLSYITRPAGDFRMQSDPADTFFAPDY